MTQINSVRKSRGVLVWLLTAGGMLSLAGCGADDDRADASARGDVAPAPVGRVVVYAASSDAQARSIAGVFEQRSGVEVLLVSGDGGALADRLVGEAASPRADVWWSADPLATAGLAPSSALGVFVASDAQADFGGGWPTVHRAADDTWYGFGLRYRVLAVGREVESPPRTLRDLAEPRWSGRIGMARPTEGDALAHLAVLVGLWGDAPVRSWLSAMEQNGLRLFESEEAVVRAVGTGEIDVGITSTGAAGVGENGVAWIWEVNEIGVGGGVSAPRSPETVPPLSAFGPVTLPSTIGRVSGGPNEAEARALIEFVLSDDGERLLLGGSAGLAPLRPTLAAEASAALLAGDAPDAYIPDWSEVLESADAAEGLAREVLGL
ncbi:MAG: extracellular solute-binding protein [Planctomycetota bacterium]